jgi:hypothetical protein
VLYEGHQSRIPFTHRYYDNIPPGKSLVDHMLAHKTPNVYTPLYEAHHTKQGISAVSAFACCG